MEVEVVSPPGERSLGLSHSQSALNKVEAESRT